MDQKLYRNVLTKELNWGVTDSVNASLQFGSWWHKPERGHTIKIDVQDETLQEYQNLECG